MLISESEALKRLSIPSWRNLSKDRFMDFTKLLPDLDKDTRLRAIEQIPNIVGCVVAMNDKILEASKNITQKNKETTGAVIESLKEIQLCFQQQLNKEDLSHEDRVLFSDKLMEFAKIYVELDKTNKGFLERHFDLLVGGAVALGLGIIALIIDGRGGSKN